MITPETTDNTFKTATDTTGAAPPVPIPDQGAFMQGAPSPTSFTLPGYTKEQQLQVAPPQFAWQPSQADLGQGQVQASGFAEMKLPFGALASRGQSIAEREQANKQAQQALKEKFDPYGGVGKAADPFQPAFGRYARNTLDTAMADIVAAFGGDEEEAIRRINTPGTQENQIYLQKARELDDIATVNRYEFQKYVALYADVMNNKQQVSPETREALKKYLSAQDETGTPIRGVDPAEFRSTRQDLEAWLSLDQYMGEFMKELPKIVQLQTQEIARNEAIRGGKFMIEQLSVRDMEPAIRQHADMYSAMSMGRVSPEQAYEEMRKIFNDEIQRELKIYGPEKPSGDGGTTTQQAATLRWSYSPMQFRTDKSPLNPKAGFEFVSAPLEKVGDKMIPPAPIKLTKLGNPRGALVMITGFQKDENGEWLVLGEEVSTKQIDEFNRWRRERGMGGVDVSELETSPGVTSNWHTWKNTSTTTTGASYQEPLSANRSQIAGKFQTADPYVLGGVTNAIAAYNRANGTKLTTADFSKMSREDQEAVIEGRKVSETPSAADPSEAEVKKAFPGAIKDPKHGWVAKGADGKWRKVTL